MKKLFPYLLLLLGAIAMVLSNGRFLISVAAWVFPILFLLAIRHWTPKKSLLILILICGVCNQISFNHMVPSLSIPFFNLIPAFAGAMYAFPFFFQKLAYKRRQTFWVTLVLPLTYALLDYLNLYFNPNGTFGILGYSQHNLLPVAQWASLVGVVGLTFIIMWTGSIIYWLILSPQAQKRKYVIGFTVILLMLLTYSMFRLSSTKNLETVRVSGLHIMDREAPVVTDLQSLFENESDTFYKKTAEQMEKLLDITESEARSGAKIISHSEGSIIIDATQKIDYLNKIQSMARQYQIYIVTVPYILSIDGQPNENVLYIIDPQGDIVVEHYKYGGNMFEGSVLGDKIIRGTDSPYGKLSGIICWDKDFPTVVDQVGKKQVDTLFIPSADWFEVTPYHTVVGNFRGIENGANVVTQSVNGMSMIADYTGQVMAEMNHFESKQWIMRGKVPIGGTKTLYTLLSPYYVFCVIIGLVLIGLYIRKGTKV